MTAGEKSVPVFGITHHPPFHGRGTALEPAMIATAVHHISFAVSDLDRSRRFYEEILGLEQIARPDFGLPGVWYTAGNAQIHLIETPAGADVGSGPATLTPLANHNAFAVDDYEKALAHFKRHELEVLETNAQAGQMWLRDPDGNILEFIANG
jgi:catechol 2,3-dioxygenase-like lactoylglutathione lyase family enzyme